MTTVVRFLELAGTFAFLMLALWLVGNFTPKAEGWPPPRDPWGSPDPTTRVHSAFWRPWMDLADPLPLYPPPQPWQRVGA